MRVTCVICGCSGSLAVFTRRVTAGAFPLWHGASCRFSTCSCHGSAEANTARGDGAAVVLALTKMTERKGT